MEMVVAYFNVVSLWRAWRNDEIFSQ